MLLSRVTYRIDLKTILHAYRAHRQPHPSLGHRSSQPIKTPTPNIKVLGFKHLQDNKDQAPDLRALEFHFWSFIAAILSKHLKTNHDKIASCS